MQWDLGKNTAGQYIRQGSLDKPPRFVRSLVGKLKADPEMERSILPSHISTMFLQHSELRENYSRPKTEDLLFHWSHIHRPARGPACANCDTALTVKRPARPDPSATRIFYGNIASGNSVMKNAQDRDRIAHPDDIIAYEMEAAGIMDCRALVIRGVCDYADSHKNDEWHRFAAVAAAAYAKTLIHAMPTRILSKERVRGELLTAMNGLSRTNVDSCIRRSDTEQKLGMTTYDSASKSSRRQSIVGDNWSHQWIEMRDGAPQLSLLDKALASKVKVPGTRKDTTRK